MANLLDNALRRVAKYLQIKPTAYFSEQVAKSFWAVSRHVFLFFLLILVYLFIVFSNPQGIDIINEVIKNNRYWFWTILSLLAFSASLWFCTTFLFELKQISYDKNFINKNKSGLEFWMRFIPVLFAELPFLLLIFKTDLYTGESYPLVIILLIILFCLPILVLKMLNLLKNTFENVNWFNHLSMDRQPLNSLLHFRDARNSFYIFLGYTIFLFILSLVSVEIGFAVTVGPIAIMVFGLSFIGVVLSILMYFNVPGRRPFLLYCIIFIAIFSIFNDNSEIRTLPQKSERTTLEKDFENWALQLASSTTKRAGTGTINMKKTLDRKRVPSDSSLNAPKDSTTLNFFFIAAEGGGIRALYWTALVLATLERRFPGIHNKIYGISGASGGGVGAVFYTSYLHDQLVSNTDPVLGEANFKKSIRNDFLSDVLAAFMFQDNLQNLLPIPVPDFDRTRRLEDAWSKAFSFHNRSDTFEKSFLDLYADSTLRLPRLFVNGVLAESGQKTIVTYPLLHSTQTPSNNEPDVLKDELDVIATIGKDIPVKTVASLCSRFPYITSGGLIRAVGEEKIGHIIDGGYKENTGLETVWQLLLRLKPTIIKVENSKMFKENRIRLRPVVIFIKNSPLTQVIDGNRRIPRLMHELRMPIDGFMNAADRKTPTIDALTENVFKYYNDKNSKLLPCEYIRIDLDRTTKEGLGLPLGWYFSDGSFTYVDGKIRESLSENSPLIQKIKFCIK